MVTTRHRKFKSLADADIFESPSMVLGPEFHSSTQALIKCREAQGRVSRWSCNWKMMGGKEQAEVGVQIVGTVEACRKIRDVLSEGMLSYKCGPTYVPFPRALRDGSISEELTPVFPRLVD